MVEVRHGVYFLLDRSGSMQTRWKEAVSSINEYLQVMKNVDGDIRATLATFDFDGRYTRQFNPVQTVFPDQYPETFPNTDPKPYIDPWKKGNFPASKPWLDSNGYLQTKYDEQWKKTGETREPDILEIIYHDTSLKHSNVMLKHNGSIQPRGTTPLFDAVAKMISIMDKDNYEKSVLVIMTDGYENASKDYTKSSVTELLESRKARGWEVVFLGADFSNVYDDSVSMGNKAVNMTAGNYRATMDSLSLESTLYYNEGKSIDINKVER